MGGLYSLGVNSDLGMAPGYIGEGYDIGNPDQSQMSWLMQLMDNPWFRAGMAYNYGQGGMNSLSGMFNNVTRNKLSYIDSLAKSREQVTTGGHVYPAQMQPWNPAMIAALIDRLGSAGRG